MTCSACLAKSVAGKGEVAKAMSGLVGTFGFVAGLMLSWFVFHGLGDTLLRIPDTFHDGTIWSADHWLD